MLTSMWSGVSGLRTHQQGMDVIGNDIDSDEWIKAEVNNFVGAMSTLIEKDISFMNLKVNFYWLDYTNGELTETPAGNNG